MKNIILSIILVLVLSLTVAFAISGETDNVVLEDIPVVTAEIVESGDEPVDIEYTEDPEIVSTADSSSTEAKTDEISSNTDDLTGTTTFQLAPFLAVVAVIIIVAVVALLSKND